MITIISTKEDQHNDFNSMIIKICMGTLSDEETQKFLEETGLRLLDERESQVVLNFMMDIPELKNLNAIIVASSIIVSENENSDTEIPHIKTNIKIVQYKNGVYEIWINKHEIQLRASFIINKNNKICLCSYYDTGSGYEETQEIVGNKLRRRTTGTFVRATARNENVRILDDILDMDEHNLTPCDSTEYKKIARFLLNFVQETLNNTSVQYFVKKISDNKNAYLVKSPNLNMGFITLDNQFINIIRCNNSIYDAYLYYVFVIEDDGPKLIMSKQSVYPMVDRKEIMLSKYLWSFLMECEHIRNQFDHKHKIDGFEKPKSFTTTKMTHEELLELSQTGDLQERDIIT